MFQDLIRSAVDYHGDLARNIKTIRESQALFDDLSADAADWSVAIAAESQDYIASAAPLVTRPFDYGAVITYPFVPHHWQQTRFSDGLHYGVWYGSLEMETTVPESIYHWRRFIDDSFKGEDREIVGERRVFDVRCDAIVMDLRGGEARFPQLVDRASYAYTHALGRYLHDQSQSGVLVRSARGPGDNAAILRPQVLSSVRDRCYLTYVTNPTRDEVVVRRQNGRAWMTVRPSELA
ncbi:MAG TPA: RES family NAD+ phosphorylase [Burkholderiales bacterium]|nr:RES family NAD+ phosphorylase [Burkholderiales bacterium]